MKYVKSFQPIESDPQVLTHLMHSLGVHESFSFEDVLDLEEESLQPAHAVIVIFPESDEDEARKSDAERQRTPITGKNLHFLRQTIDTSCGLIAILHCILNTDAADSIKLNSILYNAKSHPNGITAFLESSTELEEEYKSAVELGETEVPDEVMYHYVALVTYNNQIYELDGERLSPLLRGTSAKDGYILHDSQQILQIMHSLTQGRIDCSLYKLTQSRN